MSSNFAPFLFVIDTDTYAGNFEREMCAWITGRFGECSHGLEEASAALYGDGHLTQKAFNWFCDHIAFVSDEHGCSKPVEIYPTPGYFNDGNGNHWPDGTDPRVVRRKYLASIRKDKPTKNELAAAEKSGPWYAPAYLSVAINLDMKPPKKILETMKQRALSYLTAPCGGDVPKTILGFRLTKQTLQTEEESV